MITNGIKHNFKKGDLVWSVECTAGQVFRVENVTAKRIVCREVDQTGQNKHLATSNHCPSNLFIFEGKLQ